MGLSLRIKAFSLTLLIAISIPSAVLAQTYQEVGSWGGPGGGGGTFNAPVGFAEDRSGNIYVADYLNSRVQKFSSNGDFLTMWGKKGTSPGDFQLPLSIAVDSSGNVYVADRDVNVQKFSSDGQYLGMLPVAGKGVAVGRDGNVYVVGDTVIKLSARGDLLSRFGGKGFSISLDDSGYVYIVGQMGYPVGQDSMLIRRYKSDGTLVNSWKRGPVCCDWDASGRITVDSARFVYVSSIYEGLIIKYSTAGFLLDQFSYPGISAISLLRSGNLLVSANYSLQVITTNGAFIKGWGQFGGQGDGHFTGPFGIGIDTAKDYVYVGDMWDSRVQRLSLDGTFQTKWGTNVSAGGQFDHPGGIAVDETGNVYVNDYCVMRFDSTGFFYGQWRSLSQGTPIAAKRSGFFYIADGNNQIRKLSTSGSTVLSFGTTGTGDGQFMTPRGIGLDKNGNIYVVDHGNYSEYSRLQKFDSLGTFRARWNLGVNAWDGSPRIAGISFDKSNNVLVIDDGSGQLFKFSPGGALLAKWRYPYGSGPLALDKYGRIYMTSGWNGDGRIHIYAAQPPTVMSALDCGQVGLVDSTLSSVSISNPFPTTLSIWTLMIGPSGSRLVSDQQLTIPPKGNATTKVWLKAQSTGAFTDTLWTYSDAGLLKYPLKGNSPYPYLAFRQQRLDFGVLSKDSTRRLTLTIVDTSVNPLRIDTLYAKSKYFKIPFQQNPAIVKRGDSLNYVVTFTPDSARVFVDTLYVQSNSSAAISKIGLKGEGTAIITSALDGQVPNKFVLYQNYPNPFNPSTKIAFDIPQKGDVSLKIIDVLGRVVSVLVDETKEPGHYELRWNANVPTGIYFYRLQTGESIDTKKMILLK
jgi:tripartite motif-containing protein 71